MVKTSLPAIGFCGAMLFGFAVHAADTWFVKAANFGKEGLDGRTEETAWGTLQDAHDNAAAGDTIKVLEGIYDKGENYCSYSKRTNRLVVAKKLFFEAVGSRDNTHIVGKISTVKVNGTASADGRGADGMRCVSVTDKGWGSTFTGFTFRDGSTSNDGSDPYGNDGKSEAGGGAITVAGGSLNSLGTYFIDCVISNCVGTWGAAMRGGTAIRCFIVNNRGSSFGGVCCTAGLWNSVVVGVKQLSNDRPACGNGCTIVNSTIAATSSRGYNRYGNCYNTLFTSCGAAAMGFQSDAEPSYYSCTNTATGVFSPATWDFRPVAGMEAHNNGKTSYITDILTLPEGVEMKDFNGNPIDLTKETCDIGAVQGAVENASGAVVLPLGTLVDGVPFRSIRPHMRVRKNGRILLSSSPLSTSSSVTRQRVTFAVDRRVDFCSLMERIICCLLRSPTRPSRLKTKHTYMNIGAVRMRMLLLQLEPLKNRFVLFRTQ